MMTDIMTIVWKERKGLLRVRGRRAQALLTMMSPLFLAIYLPWSAGADWVESGLSVILSIIVPFLLVGITVPDSFAGERERHTLPTLLASRLPDRAILFGKLVTSIAFGWGSILVLLVVSLVAVNVAHGDGQLMLYQPTILAADLALSFLVAVLTATLGVLISLRSSTAQEAQQTLMAVLMVPIILFQVGGVLILESESGNNSLREVLATVSFEQVILVVVTILFVVDLVLLRTAMARFKRSRLVLSQ